MFYYLRFELISRCLKVFNSNPLEEIHLTFDCRTYYLIDKSLNLLFSKDCDLSALKTLSLMTNKISEFEICIELNVKYIYIMGLINRYYLEKVLLFLF